MVRCFAVPSQLIHTVKSKVRTVPTNGPAILPTNYIRIFLNIKKKDTYDSRQQTVFYT